MDRNFQLVQAEVHANSVAKGFWDEPRREVGTSIALIHSELSELLEAYRKGLENLPSPKECSTGDWVMTNAEEELADVVIRCMDFAESQGIDLWNAILAKHAYNTGRPYKHGKQF